MAGSEVGALNRNNSQSRSFISDKTEKTLIIPSLIIFTIGLLSLIVASAIGSGDPVNGYLEMGNAFITLGKKIYDNPLISIIVGVAFLVLIVGISKYKQPRAIPSLENKAVVSSSNSDMTPRIQYSYPPSNPLSGAQTSTSPSLSITSSVQHAQDVRVGTPDAPSGVATSTQGSPLPTPTEHLGPDVTARIGSGIPAGAPTSSAATRAPAPPSTPSQIEPDVTRRIGSRTPPGAPTSNTATRSPASPSTPSTHVEPDVTQRIGPHATNIPLEPDAATITSSRPDAASSSLPDASNMASQSSVDASPSVDMTALERENMTMAASVSIILPNNKVKIVTLSECFKLLGKNEYCSFLYQGRAKCLLKDNNENPQLLHIDSNKSQYKELQFKQIGHSIVRYLLI